MKQYDGALRCVQVMPLDDEGVPLHQIYGSVFVEENLTALKKTRRPDELSGSKTLESVADMFFIKNELAKRVFMQGEAGHGKTVFCLKVLDCWSKSKICRGADKEKGGGSEKTKYIGKHTEVGQGSESDRCINKTLLTTAQGSLSSSDDDNNDYNGGEDKELQSCLSLFDLTFYVPLRHAAHGISTIVDLVCGSVSECDNNTEQNIKQILRDGKIKCLIILDGLDEWRAPDTCRVRGFPDSYGLVNCTLLCTMRPWRMVNLQLRLDATCDKVVQILGLKEKSIAIVIRNVLMNFYGLDIHSALYKQKFKHFYGKTKLPEMKSLLKVPLILTSSCLVWDEEVVRDGDQCDLDYDDSKSMSSIESDYDYYSYSHDSSVNGGDKKAVSYFMTFFYLKLMEITITRAKLKHDIVRSFLLEKQKDGNKPQYITHILSVFRHITDFFEVIKSIGRLALQDFVSDQTCLVFPIDKLERDIGHSNVELALKAGILSQTKAPGLSFQQRVSVSFYHKSIQEFIAALYMASGDTEALTSFCTHCTSVDKVMELSNMIMFVCGLDPVVGCQLSEHVREVVNCDTDIIQYRESTDNGDKVEKMYKIQCKWYSEMNHNMSYTHNTDRIPNIHVTDVFLYSAKYKIPDLYLHDHDDVSVEDVCVVSEFVSMENNSIVSVCLYDVGHPIYRIIQHLPGCQHLTTLHIMDITDTQDRELLAEVLPQLVQLQCVVYGYSVKRVPFCYGISYDWEERPPADTAVGTCCTEAPGIATYTAGGYYSDRDCDTATTGTDGKATPCKAFTLHTTIYMSVYSVEVYRTGEDYSD